LYLTAITRFAQADNLGGVIAIQVVRKADVAAIPIPVDGVIYGDITMQEGKQFVNWQVALDAGASTEGKPTREGTTKGNRLKFTVPKDRASLRTMFEQASEDEFIVRFQDANGQQKLFGLLDKPVRFRFSHATGNSQSSKNSYECEFYFDGPENLFEYNGAISVAPAGPPPALVKFGRTAGTAVVIGSLEPGETFTILSDYSYNEYFSTL